MATEQIAFQPFTAIAREKQLETGPEYITTFRKGTKWARPELIGQTVALFDEGNQVEFAYARFVSAKVCQFKDLSELDYALQSPESGDAKSALNVLKQVYGESFSEDTVITVVELGDINHIAASASDSNVESAPSRAEMVADALSASELGTDEHITEAHAAVGAVNNDHEADGA